MRTEAEWKIYKRAELESVCKKFFAEYGMEILLNESGEIAPCVYFVQRESGGPIKIGYSANIPERIAGLQTEYGKLKVLLIIRGSFRKEKSMHKQFAKYRLYGEWFEPAPAVLNEIERLKRGEQMDKLVITDRIFKDVIVKVYRKTRD